MQVVDLRRVAEIAHQHRTWLLVDNTFATPFCQRPLTLGADIVVHSTTKYLSGHGVVIGGAVVSPHVDFVRQEVKRVLKSVGASPSPFDAWITNLGLKTFELRMRRHCRNAMAVARFLQVHPKVDQVNYPGLDTHAGHQVAREQMSDFGGMLSFTLKGGFAAAEKLINNLQLPTLVGSLGNVDTLIAHPASMSHSGMSAETRRKMGVSDGLVRFSVGIENVQDILADLDQALKGV
jgi:methionine-gamma-lyase